MLKSAPEVSQEPSQEALLAALAERERELAGALERQTATADILKVIASSPSDTGPVFETIAATANRLIGGLSTAVFRYIGDSLHLVAFTPTSPAADAALKAAFPISLADLPILALVRDGEVAQFVDTEAEDVPPINRELARLRGYRAMLFTPLMSNGAAIGLFSVTRQEPGPFDAHHIQLTRTFADQAVIAINNANLFNETQEALKQQTATAEVLKVISRSAFDLDPVLQTLVTSAGTLCGADRGIIWLRKGDLFHSRATFGHSAEGRAFVEAHPRSLDDKSLVPRVARSGRTEQIPDCLLDPEYFFDGYKQISASRSLLGVPLLRDGRVEGVFTLTRALPAPFATRQIELVETFANQSVIAIENARLFDEVKARTRDLAEALRQQTATADVLKVISRSAFDLQLVLDTLVRSAAELSGSSHGTLYIRDGDAMRFGASFGNTAEYIDHLRRNPQKAGCGSMGSRVLLTGTIHNIADILVDPDYDPDFRSRYSGRALLGMPLMRDQQVVGAFGLSRSAPGLFSGRDIEIVQTFADQAVIAIENVRLFDEVNARTNDLAEALQQQTATADVLKVISRSAFDLQAVFDTLISSGVRLIGGQSGTICLRDGDVYRYRAHFGLVQVLAEWLAEHPATPGRATAAGRVLLSSKVECIVDVLDDKDYVVPAHEHNRIRSMLAAPLLRDDRVEGVLVINRAEPGPFTQRQIELVQTFADQAVIALENARLFDEVQARTRDLQEALQQQTATADVLKVISRSAFDLQAVFDAVVASAVELTAAHSGTICVCDGEAFRYRSFSGPGANPELEKYLAEHPAIPGRASIAGRAVLTGQVEQIPDLREDADYAVPMDAHGNRARALLGVPLLGKAGVEGAIILTRLQPGAYPRRQIEILQTFADQAVIAIENVRLFEQVQARTKELVASLENLQKAQDRLVQSEKLASLGQLTAGIAHEIKNPLNFVNNFSALSRELLVELGEVIARAPLESVEREEADELIGIIGGNLDKVVQHGKRADSIVKNMLLHAREGSGERSSVRINAMVEEALNLAYHGARAEKPDFNVTIAKSLDPDAGAADIFAQEITRVLLNLISNGFYATIKRKQAEGDGAYEPTIKASTRDLGKSVEIVIRDNGTGIPDEVKAKIFNPFFTTKPAGEGTGLGLSLSHDIVVKQHGGTLEVSTEPGAYTLFTVVLPRAGVGG
jgi:two-component system, NtrC family, sensor kinase